MGSFVDFVLKQQSQEILNIKLAQVDCILW